MGDPPPKMPRNQGRQQAAKAAAAGSSIGSSSVVAPQARLDIDSALSLKLLKKWAWFLSANELQQFALASHEDEIKLLDRVGAAHSWCSTSLELLANLGSKGRHPGNVKRELLHLLGTPLCPQVVHSSVQCVSGKLSSGGDSIKHVDMPFLLPHYSLAFFYHNARSRFDFLMFGGAYDRSAVTTFWTTVCQRRDPRIVRHPMCARSDWMSKAIPVMLHGDAVPAIGVHRSNSKSYDTYSWQSVFASGATTAIKQYLFGIFEDCKTKPANKTDPGTMQQCWKIVVWSFRAAFEGKWPARDWNDDPWPLGSFEHRVAGEDLADGFFAVLWSLKGDLDYFAKGLFLRHYGRKDPPHHSPHASSLRVPVSEMAKTPVSKTWFSENDLGPKPGGPKPVKRRPRRPLESRKRTIH